jgi:hypothetical protein
MLVLEKLRVEECGGSLRLGRGERRKGWEKIDQWVEVTSGQEVLVSNIEKASDCEVCISKR